MLDYSLSGVRSDTSERWAFRELLGFDSERSWRLHYINGDELDRLDISARDATQSHFDPSVFSGLRLYVLECTLAQTLDRGTALFEGSETVAGNRCCRLRVSDIPTESDPITLVTWLDPARDFLPRRLEYRRSSSAAPWFVLENLEFRQADDLRGGRRWIPARSRAELPDRLVTEMTLNHVALNTEVPANLFRVDPGAFPDGVAVADAISGRHYVTGGRSDLYDQRHQRLGRSEPAEQQDAPAIEAVAPRGAGWLPWVIASVSALLLFSAAWLFLTHRGRRR